MIKALKMRLACGARGYEVLRELSEPLPTERTLQRHLESYKFEPGLLHPIMESLALKVRVNAFGTFHFDGADLWFCQPAYIMYSLPR